MDSADTALTRRTALFGSALFTGDVTTTNGTIANTSPDLQASGLSISPGIFIDAKTGNVTIPEGLSLNDASRAFWDAVSDYFPKLAAEHCKK